ncbi:hypothetical protein GALMADRAFT_884482 [Galerina marginata CBS 339.88]|uniref:Uncharacterized protein n=1 Tax=Galerina marginata (strain CBS 339.88) TaxID=685588 RepID=A0A067SRS7_GALM3|nr:hypothetical protein GALMADRAFT_884482 [Galerina marginata CBS 339.88]
MARFEIVSFLALAMVVLFYRVDAAPIGQSIQVQNNQLGNFTCNVERLQTIVGLGKSAKSIQKAIKAAGSDTATTSQLQTAAGGITSAQAGVNTILQALFTGQTAPANARQQVGDGLNVATTALNSANSTNIDVTSAIATAQSAVAGTLAAGEKVLSECN